MASAYLGPEIHRPLAVISESYRTRYRIPYIPEPERYAFGEEFEERMYQLLQDHLELGTTDRLAYVGDMRGSMALSIQEKFCLITPVQTIIPGHFHYADTDGHKMVPIRIAHVGAEEFFRNLNEDSSSDKPQYDKLLVFDCVRYLADARTTYANMAAALAPGGKMLLIHRPSALTTLPFFNDAKQRLIDNDMAYMSIIKDLQACRLDVTWEMECLPVRMPKAKWYSMVRSKFPTQMEIMSDMEVHSGLRELSEGVLKYEGEMVEFMDRLLFITAVPSQQPGSLPSVQRSSAEMMSLPEKTNLRYTMKLDPDEYHKIRQCLPRQDTDT